MRKYCLLVLFLSGVYANVKTQDAYLLRVVDSLLYRYDTTAVMADKTVLADKLATYYFRAGEHRSSAIYARKSMGHAREAKLDKLIGEAYFALMLNKVWTTHDSIDFYADSAIQYFALAKVPERIVDLKIESAYHHARNGNCEMAFLEIGRADSISQFAELKPSLQLRVRIRYCNILANCEVFKQVTVLALEAIPMAKAEGNLYYLGIFYDVLMTAYAYGGKRDSAYHYMNKMEELLPQVDRSSMYSLFYTNAANTYMVIGEFERAYEIQKIGAAYDKLHQPYTKQVTGLYNLGEISLRLNKFADSRDYFKSVLPYYQEVNDWVTVRDIYRLLGRVYAGLNDFDTATEYWEKGDVLRDSLEEANLQETIAEMSIEFETERISRELSDHKLALAQAEQKVAQNRFIGLLLVVFIVVGVLSLLILRSRRRRKSLAYDKRQAELRYNLLRAQMNPHFIFNSLNSIQSFFSNQRFGKGNEFLGTFSQLVRRVLEQTGQNTITLAEELETLMMYLELEKIRLGSTLAFNLHLDEQVEQELIQVPPLIFQPFVENAIWHGIAPKGGPGNIDIYLDYREHEDLLYCVIEDDGVGMHIDKNVLEGHRSKGVAITRERLGKNGQINIQNRADTATSGVRTELIIPLWN